MIMMTATKRSGTDRKSLHVFKSIGLAILIGALSACDGIGSLVSNDGVSDADNDQVVAIGDSIFALSGDIQDSLETYAGETFRRYTLSGAELSGGIIAKPINKQYQIALSDNSDIDIILMDGGGNDLLIPAILFDPYDCLTDDSDSLSQSCKELADDVYVDAVNLLNQMYSDGVEHVIYQGYYYTKNGIFHLKDMKQAIDYGDGRLAMACEFSVVDCQFVDPRPVITEDDIIIDGIHPASSGSKKIADLDWLVLKELL